MASSVQSFGRVNSLAWVGLFGGLGGAINAWLCYLKWPVAASSGTDDFLWPIIPAGLLHGALLAVIAVGVAAFLWKYSLRIRLAGLLVGWLAGWISFIPLDLYIVCTVGIPFHNKGLSWSSLYEVFFWPFRREVEILWLPYLQFGLAAALYYVFLNLFRQLSSKNLGLHIFMGIASGCMGSLWWWIRVQPWYFSLLHGAIWGSLVGFGAWKSQQSS